MRDLIHFVLVHGYWAVIVIGVGWFIYHLGAANQRMYQPPPKPKPGDDRGILL